MLCFRCGSHNPDGSEFCSQCGQKFVDRKTSRDPTSPEMKAARNKDVMYSIDDEIAERYKVKGIIDSGPVGAVYRTHDMEIDVDVAVKVIEPKLLQTKNERRSFLSEIRAVRKIKHANVIRLYDEDEDGDKVFFTMQMLEGLSLRKIINLRQEKSQDFQLKEIIPIFSHICQALDLAHETTAHGDLKPENIIVLPDLLKITDFGLVHAIPHQPFVAAQKGYAQSIAYLAPEIRADKPTIKPAADIYSLGVILCEMLTADIYEGPSSSLPTIPKEYEGLSRILKKSLNENPSNRYRTPREFFEDLHKAASSPPSKHKVPKPPRPAPTRKNDTPPPVKPPRAAPSRKETYTVGDPMDPPTVVGASVLDDEAESNEKSLEHTGDSISDEVGVSSKSSDEQNGQTDIDSEEDIDNDILDDSEFESMDEAPGQEPVSSEESVSEEEIEEIEEIDELEEVLEDVSESSPGEAGEEQALDESDIEEEQEIDGEKEDSDYEEDDDVDTEPEDDQETLVTTPLTPVDQIDGRVAKPKGFSPPPSDSDDVAGQLEDEPEKVEVLKSRKRQNTQPVQAILPTAPSASSQPLPPPHVSQPPVAGPVVDQTQPNLQSYPPVAYSYPPGAPGAYSQPPYGYSQPPPSSSRLPVYIFLSVITVIVGIAVFFLVDYLIAAKKQLSNADTRTIADNASSQKDPLLSSKTSAREKALAEEEKKLAAERKRVEQYLKDQEAKIAQERKKMEEAKKADEARLAAMKPQPKESRRQFELRREEERKKAEAKAREYEKKLAKQKQLAEQRRKAEEARLAARRKKAAEAKQKAEALRRQKEKDRKEALAKKNKQKNPTVSSNKPMLEEVPLEEVPIGKSVNTETTKGPAKPQSSSTPGPKPALAPRMPQGAKTVAKMVQPDLPPQKVSNSKKCPKGMVFIPDGEAFIGSSPNDPMRNFGELTLHKVAMQGFCIDRYEFPNIPGRKPKSNVTWKQAQRICKKRNKRLCTENEWEYACKGKSNRSFPYGKKWNPNKCNTEDGSGNDRDISAIGSFKSCRSPYGVMDMSGNVSEWTQDRYRSGASAKTYKGGSATRPNWASRCASRSSLSPGARKADLGFRCCANPK